MNRNTQVIVVSMMLVFLIILLFFLLSKINPKPLPLPPVTPTASPVLLEYIVTVIPDYYIVGSPSPSFRIENRGMTQCSEANIKDVCSRRSSIASIQRSPDFFVQGSDICIVWKEWDRESDTLSISIHNKSDDSEIVTYTPSTKPPVDADCKFIPVNVNPPLPPGNYYTVFHIGGHPSDDPIQWTIMNLSRAMPEREMTLSTITNPNSYQRVGDNITYIYTITNTGTSSIGPSQLTVSDSKRAEPINCGSPNTTLNPTGTVVCYATYVITKADIDAGSVTSTARLEGAEPVTTTLTSGCKTPSGWVTYDLRSTETLDEISTWYSDLTVAKLMQANCLNTSTISAGQKIYVPGSPLPAKIRGIVFMDPNHNDIQDRNELGLSGAPVKITDSNGAVVATTTTGANGVFEIDLPPGTYFVFQFQVILLPGEVRNQRFAVVPVP